MRFHHYSPAPSLQPFLQGYIEADCRSSLRNSTYTLFPNGLSGIFFNFGNTGKLILEKEYDTPAISIFGQIDKHFTVADAPGFYSLGVLFKPTNLSKFLRVDISEFTNRAVDGTLLRADLRRVHEQLTEATRIQQKITLLNEYFCRALLNLSPQNTISDHAVHLIDTQENLTIEKLAGLLHISQRYLEMNFKRSVGLSPKSYSLIQRFMRIERKLKKEPEPRQHLNFGDEYYDQMHFTKDFKRFTGHTPGRYLLENLEMGKSYLIRP
ncbi:MAG TPA: AraC family transcriptional regulator [Cyclobacteriaceae bacterium]|nr:AraC family transcriptional regulator [Cyclobacteriaceae bacterium]